MSKADWPIERGLLGSAILDPLVLDEYADTIAPEDFSKPQHGNLWRYMRDLRANPQYARMDSASWSSVVYHQATGWGADVEGIAYVVALPRDAVAPEAAAYYSRKLREQTISRALADAAQKVLERLKTRADPSEVVAGMESDLAAIAQRASLHASPWVVIGDTAAKVYTDLQEAARNPEAKTRRVLPTPWVTLNTLLRGGLRRGEMTVLAGRPGTGKTAAAWQVAQDAALRAGVGVFSMEMTREALTQRELARVGDLDLTAINRGVLTDGQWRALTQGVETLAERPIWIDDAPSLHVTQLRARAKRLQDIAAKAGTELRLVVVDYMQLATATVGRNEGGEAIVARISQSLVALAKELDVAVLALAQMNRAVEGRAEEKPRNSDLRGSGQIEQDAAAIVFTYADIDRVDLDERSLVLTKARHGETGEVHMRWYGSRQSLIEVDAVREERPRPQAVDDHHGWRER